MIRGLGDYKKDDKKGKKTESYAGGESSGMAVENDELEQIVQKARQGGRQGADERKEDGKEKTQLKITLYSNGFQVDEGAFRPYESEENKAFMKELNEGYVPKEIQDKYRGKGVSVGLEDRRKEAFRPPTPPKYVAYSGSGASMGGTQGQGLSVNKDAGGLPSVDDSQDKTTIQIRFHNGERASITLNLHHRVSDIHNYVMNAAPVEGEYQLVFGFPPRALNDPMKTIEEAGLKSAAITQKII